jgi:hypothetical protein
MTQGVIIERRECVYPNALWAALAEHEDAAGIGEQVQDSFSYGAMQALALEPLAVPALHPENWKKLNAGIDIAVRVTRKGVLCIDVSPWAERCSVAKEPFVDFVAFPGSDPAQRRPTVTIFELRLEELQLELRYASANADGPAVKKRQLVYLAYQHVLQCLSLHFEVRVQTALLCLGAECRLMIRRMDRVDNLVDRPAQWPARISWHRKYLELCEKSSAAPDELATLFEQVLRPLEPKERERVLRQYLGVSERSPGRRRSGGAASDTTPELARALTVVASPEAFPPLMNHPCKLVEACLMQAAKASEFSRLNALARHYCVDVDEMLGLLRGHYPKVLLEVFKSAEEMRPQLEYFVTEKTGEPRTVEELVQRILLQLGRAWNAPTNDERSIRKRKLSQVVGFKSFDRLIQWAQQYAPVMLPWLKSL